VLNKFFPDTEVFTPETVLSGLHGTPPRSGDRVVHVAIEKDHLDPLRFVFLVNKITVMKSPVYVDSKDSVICLMQHVVWCIIYGFLVD
jgi:hypothetical protein